MDGDKTNLYAILGVSKAADEKEVCHKYCMSVLYHFLPSFAKSATLCFHDEHSIWF